MQPLRPVLVVSFLMARLAMADVVINEIFYNAPDDLDRLEYVELTNTGNEAVMLDGWKLSGEIKFQFPAGSRLDPGKFFVVAKDRELLKEFYGTNAIGEFKKSLSNRGGELKLSNAEDQIVDTVHYLDRPPWPLAADGYSASLERVNGNVSAMQVSNWAPSKLSRDDGSTPSGTPGARNSVTTELVPPMIRHVEWNPKTLQVGEALQLTVTPENTDEIRSGEVYYRLVAPGDVGAEQRIQLKRRGEKLVADVPTGTEPNRLLRFRIVAQATSGAIVKHPHPNEIRPAFTAYVSADLKPDVLPLVHFFFIGSDQHALGERYRNGQVNPGDGGYRGDFRGRPREFGGPSPNFRDGRFGQRRRGRYEDDAVSALLPQGPAALIYRDPQSGTTEVFDFINITRRKSGWKARFHKDRPLLGMSTTNFLYEPDERTIINETLSYDLYELAGNKTPQHGFMRLAVNGKLVGYHLYFEQPNAQFFSRNEINNDGDLYKLIWMGNAEMSSRVPESQRRRRPDITGRYEKKSNRHQSSEDLIALIESLENANSDDETWRLIEKHFDVDQVINYFAVNSLVSHWDGFFNNYFAYFDRQGTGKWSLYPWDQDSTWSQRGGAPYELYNMPLFFGAEGATPDGMIELSAAERAYNRNRGGFGRPRRGFDRRRTRGYGWWREGGDFSRPLLANPTFYSRFTKRLGKLTQTEFTEDKFGPRIDGLQSSLASEFRLRAELRNANQDVAMRNLDRIIDGLHEHLRERRAFVRAEIAKSTRR